MKIRFFYILPVLILFISNGCFDLGLYVSETPLSPAGSERTDPALAGSWEKDSGTAPGEFPDYIDFTEFNQHEFVLSLKQGGEISLARAFVTTINDHSFLNIQDLSGDDRQFVFCRYELSPEGNLELNFVSDTCFKEHPPESSKKLLKQIKKNLSNPDLFSREMRITLKRIDPAPLRINKARK